MDPPAQPATATPEQVILPHLDAAYNLARWLLRDPVLAEDAVQDAVVRALSYLASFKGGDARAWLLRIVRNAAWSLLAARRLGATTSLDESGATEVGEIADSADDPEAALSRREGFARLEDALATLPAELRECLVLHELEELSYKQVAEITGVPIGTVMSRLWRARRALFGQQAGGDLR
jgi:RNA polymerase sigma-70 factor (ECF subfamily)